MDKATPMKTKINIDVASKTTVSRTLDTQICDGKTYDTKVCICINQGAIVTLYDFLRGDHGVLNRVVDIIVGKGASLVYFYDQQWGATVVNRTSIMVRLESSAQFRQELVCSGGKSVQINQKTMLVGKDASALIKGALVLFGQTKHDLVMDQFHQAPHTTSNVNIRGVCMNESKSRYEGTIIIEKNACHAAAHEQHKSILVHESAQAFSIPNMQVSTDQVQCGHGSAVACLDSMHIFYLESRGIPRKKAQIMILQGFLTSHFSTNLCADIGKLIEYNLI